VRHIAKVAKRLRIEGLGEPVAEQLDPWRWERLSVVARELGVSARTLQFWCAGKEPGYRPALAHQLKGRRIQVQPAAAFEHLRQYARKMSLQTPAGLDEKTNTRATTIGRKVTANILEQLASSPDIVREHGTEVARAMISASSELRRAAGDRAKTLSVLTPEEYSKGLRAAMQLFVSHVEDMGARRCSARVLGFIRKQFGVDLVDRHPAAAALLERELREDHNSSLKEFCQAIEDRCRGVRLLEGLSTVQTSAPDGGPSV
jgi:hypothetical protein